MINCNFFMKKSSSPGNLKQSKRKRYNFVYIINPTKQIQISSYAVKWIIFNMLHGVMCCGCVLESPHRGDSNAHPRHAIL